MHGLGLGAEGEGSTCLSSGARRRPKGSEFRRSRVGEAPVKASQEVRGMMSLWKGVGETNLGRMMGDASAAIGIIPRMGVGKVRHFNTSWLWVQEQEASRELEYHKVKGSDNTTDIFTKALGHDCIRRHTKSMGSGFTYGRDPLAFQAIHERQNILFYKGL